MRSRVSATRSMVWRVLSTSCRMWLVRTLHEWRAITTKAPAMTTNGVLLSCSSSVGSIRGCTVGAPVGDFAAVQVDGVGRLGVEPVLAQDRLQGGGVVGVELSDHLVGGGDPRLGDLDSHVVGDFEVAEFLAGLVVEDGQGGRVTHGWGSSFAYWKRAGLGGAERLCNHGRRL